MGEPLNAVLFRMDGTIAQAHLPLIDHHVDSRGYDLSRIRALTGAETLTITPLINGHTKSQNGHVWSDGSIRAVDRGHNVLIEALYSYVCASQHEPPGTTPFYGDAILAADIDNNDDDFLNWRPVILVPLGIMLCTGRVVDFGPNV